MSILCVFVWVFFSSSAHSPILNEAICVNKHSKKMNVFLIPLLSFCLNVHKLHWSDPLLSLVAARRFHTVFWAVVVNFNFEYVHNGYWQQQKDEHSDPLQFLIEFDARF